ncbi:hypothetical protein [uncultured Sulfitobacter sp.]|uniref:hypothetical protein n=1 Tax=uncultured Sulfitobacter sp. TaxID=191468 RepID=UPI00261B48A2|nr:hypothetical protein [uncultured Sulfitobacter sp.]
MKNLAVFTGDIVRSSDLEAGSLDDIFAALEAAAQVIAEWPDSTAPFARFRGDGWQMALPTRFALRGALILRAAVRTTGKARDTRIGIGLGQGTLQNGDLAGADGPAFVLSGRALDSLKRTPLMAAPNGPAILRAALPLADHIIQGWTPKQAQVAQALLAPDGPTHEALAQIFGRSRQMVQKQADAAGVSALLDCCTVFEDSKCN